MGILQQSFTFLKSDYLDLLVGLKKLNIPWKMGHEILTSI